MKTIFITISKGSLIRNFFHTGVIAGLLEAGHKIVVLAPFYEQAQYFEEFEHPNLVIEPLLKPVWDKKVVIINELLRTAVFNSTLRGRYKNQIAVDVPPNPYLYPIRVYLMAPLRHIPGFRKVVQFLAQRITPDREHDYLFEKYKPDLTFVTSPKDDPDGAVMKSAKRANSKIICMPKSWDNLSNTLFPVHADKMIVWNPFMFGQATTSHGYKKEDVIMTGAPQFDYYVKKEKLLSRAEFCNQFGFDPTKKIILYGSSGANLCNEQNFVELLKQFIERGELINVQVLVRPHVGYKGDIERFEGVKHSNIVVDKTDKQDPNFKDNWDPSEDHLRHLYNSMYHADVVVNVGSTLTIDAVVNNTPVINVKFDVKPSIDFKTRSVLRLFDADYLKALLATGASYVVENTDEYLKALQAVLQRGERKEEGMARLVSEFGFKIDGNASKRITQALLDAV